MTNRLLILGSMDEFVALVKKANERGIYTVVCDSYPNGHAKRYAQKSYDIDIRDVDTISEICKKENINGIISSFSDVLFEYLVKIATRVGLKTYCTPEKSVFLREKTEMKKMFSELGIPTAKSKRIHKSFTKSDLNGLSFPLVMKPVNGYGSRGIFVASCVDEIKEKFDITSGFSSFPDSILVEEYNDGYEFNMMNWLIDGEVYTIGLADREKSVEIAGDIPHVSRVAYPSRLIDKVYNEAKEIVKKVADYTGIKTGPLSMQFFYKPCSGIQVCECAGRLFGYEHELVTYASGLDIESLLLDYVYDENEMKKRLDKHSPFFQKHSAGLYFHGYEGRVADISIADQIVDEIKPIDSIMYYQPGELVAHGIGSKPYLMRIYLKNDTREQIDAITQYIFSHIQIIDSQGKDLLYQNRLPEYAT